MPEDRDLRRLALGLALAGLALALLTPSAAHAAPACSNATLPAGLNGHRLKARFGLIGPVSCAAAHDLARRYFRKVSSGACVDKGQTCILRLGRWSCSYFFFTESQQTGGAFAGCYRAKPTRAQFRLYDARQRRQTLHADQILSPDLRVWCALGAQQTFCVTKGPGLEHGGHVDRQGTVTTCADAVCTQNWNDDATPLVAGDRTEAHGYRCTATRGGIECVRTSGPGKGKGFFVSRTSASPLPHK